MKPCVLSKVPNEDVLLFEKIRRAVNNLPDIDLGKDELGKELTLSCHILARAVGKVFALKHVDGYFYPNFQHSWLVTPQGNVIDVYPIAILGGPILVSNDFYCSPVKWLYIEENILKNAPKKLHFRRAVEKIATAISKSNKQKRLA